MKYQVTLSRTYREFKCVEVEATSKEEARKLALRKDNQEDREGYTDGYPGRQRRVDLVEEMGDES